MDEGAIDIGGNRLGEGLLADKVQIEKHPVQGEEFVLAHFHCDIEVFFGDVVVSKKDLGERAPFLMFVEDLLEICFLHISQSHQEFSQ